MIACEPTPAVAGSKLPAALTPVPLNVPPAGLPVKLLAASSTQNGPPLTLTTGKALTTTFAVALFSHPFVSVKVYVIT